MKEIYKKEIASVLQIDPGKVFLYWKGRVALYAALKAIGIKEGDEVILPAFTCVVVPNAILYLGAKPVYVDIDPVNYNSDLNNLKNAITIKTKAIICQNTFGLSSNIESIIEIARQNNIYTIEDCTHGFGGFYNGKPNGSYCDAAFYSTQWNKPFSTGIGGFLVVNNDSLIHRVRQFEEGKIKTQFTDDFIISILIFSRKYFVNNFTQGSLINLFRFLSRHNIIIGSSQGEELAGISVPKNYFKDISSSQIREGIKQLKNLENLNNLRKKNAADYTKFLKLNKKTFVNEELFPNHLFLKYPLLVKQREKFLNLARKEKINLGDWFVSPLHPVKENLNLWGFNTEEFPVSVEISKKILNLPAEINDTGKVLKFLSKHLDLIE